MAWLDESRHFYFLPCQSRGIINCMVRKAGIILLIVGIGAALLAISPAGDFVRMIIGLNRMERQIRSKIVDLSKPANYQPSAIGLARLCQSDRSFYSGDTFRPAWAPAVIRALEPSWIQIDPDYVHVEFGGGFHHFGYLLIREKEASDSDAMNNHWILKLRDESKPDQELYRFTLAKSDRLQRKATTSAPSVK